MKKTLLLTLLALLGMTQAAAQEYEYVPLVREGVKWVYTFFDYTNIEPNHEHTLKLELKGDTVINGKIYKAMHKYHGLNINAKHDTIPVYLREEGKVVYGIIPDGKKYLDCMVGNHYLEDDVYNGEEFVLYDFNDPVAYWENLANTPEMRRYFYYDTDTIALGDHQAKCHRGHLWGDFSYIEGVGIDATSCYPLYMFMSRGSYASSYYYALNCVIENDKVIYKSQYPSDNYMSMVREGVKWVNEKVIVDNGDTTHYYYTYEFRGDDSTMTNLSGTINKACYYYEGTALNVEKDSLIAGMLDNGGEVTFFRNHAYAKALDEGSLNFPLAMYLDGGTRTIYCFGTFVNCATYYMNCQRNSGEELLTIDNFYEIEPLMIDGCYCSRYAYIDEQGDTLALVVEGIGFDSRDMGDLLTPFMRPPDRTADHQEWCGLSHVVKDGKIIYKGMRYREGAFDGIDEAVADRTARPADPHYYDLMGRPVGTDVPAAPGIYIHQGKKIIVMQ